MDAPGGLDEGFDLSELLGEKAAQDGVAFGDAGEVGPEFGKDTGLDVHDGDVNGIGFYGVEGALEGVTG